MVMENFPLTSAERSQSAPMSFGQQGMWLLHQTLPDPAAYHWAWAIHFSRRVDPAKIHRSLGVIQERHEIFRTALVLQAGHLVQLIAPANTVSVPWREMDLRALPPEQKPAALNELLQTEARRLFDLAQAPLWRVAWIELGTEQVLALTFHHSIMDDWSLRLLIHELEMLYAADGRPCPADLPELLQQYANFAIGQRQRLPGTSEPLQAYWREQLKDLPPALELPTELPRPAHPSGQGAIHRFQLTGSVTTKFRELARKEGTTLFTAVLTAYQVWLYRYTGQTDILVGTPFTTRHRLKEKSLLGYFLNTLPIRTRLDPKSVFQTVLQQVRGTLLDAFRHADLPFEQMVELAVKGREPGLQPLHQVMFVLLGKTLPPLRLAEAPGQFSPMDTRTSKNDLTLKIEAEDPVWNCELEYATDVFSADGAARMARHFSELLEAIAENPQGPVCRLRLMPAAEREEILAGWNRTQREHPRGQCVHELFEEQVRRTPDAVAVVFAGASLTYQELNLRANRLAHHLQAMGVGPEVLVGLWVDRCLEMMVGLLGVLKAGGAYVPLDPACPPDRLTFILKDTQTPVVLTQRALAGRMTGLMAELNAEILCLDEEAPVWNAQPNGNPPARVQPDNVIYIIYTSGSTGEPKGCCLTHRNVARLFQETEAWFGFNQQDVWTLFHSPAFDFSVWEIWGALLYGGKLVIVPYLVSRSPQLFLELLGQQGVTVLNQTPSAFKQLMAEQLKAEREAGLKLRFIIFGGEALDMRSLQPWFARHGDQHPKLINMYGITETTVHVTYRPLTNSDVERGSVIGVPIPDLTLYVLDPAMNPCPVGVAGEMYVGGAGVARCYLHRPVLTEERFVASPFVPGERLYRTGDAARRLPNNDLEYCGRLDQQVKIRGFRIELGEIESRLGTHPLVSGCAVLAQNDATGDKFLSAFLMVRGAGELTVLALRSWLAEKLPDYMIPSRFVTVPVLPLNANGKLDRDNLAKLNAVELASGTNHEAPGNQQERELVGIWRAALHREHIGIHDNFFHLGGHSLLAVLVGSQIRRQLGLEVSLRTFFEHPTIAALAAALPGTSHQPTICPIERVARDQALPLSPSQLQLWFLDQLEPDSPLYILPLVLRLQGRLNLPVLNRSLTELARRHESLRMVFPAENHQPHIRILPATEVALERIAVTAAQPAAAVENFVRRPFDLVRGPVFRAALACLAPDDHVLALAVHHIVSDGWSLELMQRDLAQCYQCLLQERVPDWQPLPVQFADYASWEQKRMRDGELASQLDYWRKQLAGIPPRLELPLDHPRPPRQTHLGARQSVRLEPGLTHDLKALANAHQATLFLVMLSAFEILLQRLSGQEDFVVGTPVNGRQLAETQEVAGFFMNTLPLRADLSGKPSFLEVLARCRETFLQATEHQDVSFQQVVTALQTERDLSQTPVFQVFINHLSYARKLREFPGLETAQVRPAMVDSKFDLTLYFEEQDHRLQLEWVYDRALFNADRVAEMACQFESLLQQVVRSPEKPVKSHLLGSPAGSAAYPTLAPLLPEPWTGGLAERLREQAERTPDAVAVVLAGNSLTYGELNHLASHLASHLQTLGVGPNVMVGLCLERSLELVVALLAVLKAGGTLVPIDPELPQERIEFILADAQMPWLLTQLALRDQLAATGARLLFLDQALARPVGVPDVSDPGMKPEHIAYVTYTSGSTGRPKGILISQAAYLNYCGPAIDFWQLKASDRVLQFARFGFDVGLDQLLTPLLVGATVVMRPAEIWDPAVFTNVIKTHGLTAVHLPPAYWQKWVESFHQDDIGKAIGNLRLLQVGGDVMPAAGVRRWRELKIPSVRLINRYGPTEATMFSAAYDVPSEPSAEANAGRIPLGHAIGRRVIHILDEHMNPVPAGSTGEIHIGGETVASGYLNQPELTAERFIPDHFSNKIGARLYKTGDLGRFLPDGNLDFIGRLDHQVKIRGFRVELGEIEAVLGGHPEVAAGVVTTNQAGENKMLVAHVVNRKPGKLPADSLRRWLAKKLPDYMIPARFVTVPALPLNANGKVDRLALARLDGVDLASGTEFVAPRNPLEQKLAAIWREVLRLDRVGVSDNFFALGGHSLLATQVVSRLQQAYGLEIPLKALFEAPTVAKLAEQIELVLWSATSKHQKDGEDFEVIEL